MSNMQNLSEFCAERQGGTYQDYTSLCTIQVRLQQLMDILQTCHSYCAQSESQTQIDALPFHLCFHSCQRSHQCNRVMAGARGCPLRKDVLLSLKNEMVL